MKAPITFAIAGFGDRGSTYASMQKLFPDRMKVVAVADINPEKVQKAKELYGIKDELCFTSAEEMLAQDKLADVMVVSTMDRQHVNHAIPALEKGYNILMEKPISPDLQECKRIIEVAKHCPGKIIVCHVLRYTTFYNTLKSILDSKKIGDVVSVCANENVGYWHQAHSFVRGNWRNSDQTSPMILQKCCHDMDILIWLTGKRARYVSSYGNNYLFRAEKAPAGAAQRCMDCAVRAGCPYDAVRYYLESGRTSVRAGRVHWPINVLDPHPTPENIEQALRTGPYGRCVYHCDNDVVDHQVVNIELDGGTTINFTMSAFTERCYRTIKVMGTHGCVEGNMDLSHLVWHDFFGHSEEMDLNVTDGSMAGHGGGEAVMVKQFVELLASGRDDEMLSSVEHSIESHLVALLAERSRLEHGRSLPVEL